MHPPTLPSQEQKMSSKPAGNLFWSQRVQHVLPLYSLADCETDLTLLLDVFPIFPRVASCPCLPCTKTSGCEHHNAALQTMNGISAAQGVIRWEFLSHIALARPISPFLSISICSYLSIYLSTYLSISSSRFLTRNTTILFIRTPKKYSQL